MIRTHKQCMLGGTRSQLCEYSCPCLACKATPATNLSGLLQCDTVKENEVFRVETQDWTGGQIKDDDSAEDMKNIDLTLVC